MVAAGDAPAGRGSRAARARRRRLQRAGGLGRRTRSWSSTRDELPQPRCSTASAPPTVLSSPAEREARARGRTLAALTAGLIERADRHRQDRVGRVQPVGGTGGHAAGSRGNLPAHGAPRGRPLDHDQPALPVARPWRSRPTGSDSARSWSTCCPTRSSTTAQGGTVIITCQATEPRPGQPDDGRHRAGNTGRLTWTASSTRSNGSAPSRPRSRAPGSACPWPGLRRGHGKGTSPRPASPAKGRPSPSPCPRAAGHGPGGGSTPPRSRSRGPGPRTSRGTRYSASCTSRTTPRTSRWSPGS